MIFGRPELAYYLHTAITDLKEASMNIPILEIMDEEQTNTKPLKFEFELGYFDEIDACSKITKLELVHSANRYQVLDQES